MDGLCNVECCYVDLFVCYIYRSWYIVRFLFNDPATTEFYTSCHTLSLHDALPIWLMALKWVQCPGRATAWGMQRGRAAAPLPRWFCITKHLLRAGRGEDRKSTRLNSSH